MSDVRFTASITGQSGAASVLRSAARRVQRSLISLVKQEARGLAVELARNTRPAGFTNGAKQRGEKAVSKSIYRVFCIPSDVYGEIRKTDPRAADSFWANVQNARFARASKALQRAQSPLSTLPMGRLNPAIHQANRNAYGWVPKNTRPAQIVTTAEARDNYVTRIARKVGFAKAVWTNAAKDIGGRVRNTAQWVTRHKKAPGRAVVRSGPKTSVTLISSLDYMEDVLGWKATQIALAVAGGKLRKAIAMSLQQVRRRRGGG